MELENEAEIHASCAAQNASKRPGKLRQDILVHLPYGRQDKEISQQCDIRSVCICSNYSWL